MNHAAGADEDADADGDAPPEADDAGYFFDGHGIVAGDTIQLEGQANTARITAIDCDTAVLTLDSSLTWEAGLGVALPYQGAAPDIGAFECGTAPCGG